MKIPPRWLTLRLALSGALFGVLTSAAPAQSPDSPGAPPPPPPPAPAPAANTPPPVRPVARLYTAPTYSQQLDRALYLSVEAGRLDYVERLFHLGANINAPLPSNGYVTDTAPLNVAVENGDAAMVDFLLNHGADPAIASRGEYPLDVVFDSDANISTQIKIIRLLTDHGADINQHGQGQYPLIVNAFYTKKLAAVNAVITLHPNLDLLTPGKQTAVELAAKKQPAPVCRRPRYRRRQLHPHHLHRGRPRRSRRRQQIPRRWRRSQRSRPA